jgi:hypothetical protein
VFRPQYFGAQVLRSGEYRRSENDFGVRGPLISTEVEAKNVQIPAVKCSSARLRRNQFIKVLAEGEELGSNGL